MNNIDVQALIKATDKLSRRAYKICGGSHGSSWLFDKLMRYFESETAAESITFPVVYNIGQTGEATISRHGDLICKISH